MKVLSIEVQRSRYFDLNRGRMSMATARNTSAQSTALRKRCAARTEVTRAYLVRKTTQYFRDQPCVMLVVERDVRWYQPSSGEDAAETCQALLERVTLPEMADLLVLPLEARTRLRRRLGAMPDAEVYRRA